MFPIRACVRSRRVPVFTIGLVLANIVVYWHEIHLKQWEVSSFVSSYALTPARLTATPWPELTTLVTCMFLHASFFHILGNVWFLWIFGDDVEGRLGRFRFLSFYFLTGIAASLVHVFASPRSPVPTLGASGAISGVLGAYLYLFPGSTITTLVFLGPIPRTVDVPAVFFLVVWLAMQLAEIWSGGGGGVAWYAHVGGFLAGFLLAVAIGRVATGDGSRRP